MALKFINGQFVDTSTSGSDLFTGNLGTGNNSFTGIKPLPAFTGGNNLYGLQIPPTPTGYQDSGLRGVPPIPTYATPAPAPAPAPTNINNNSLVPTVNAGNVKSTTKATTPAAKTTSAPASTSAAFNPTNGQPLLVGQTVTFGGKTYTGSTPVPGTPKAPLGSVASLYTSDEQKQLDALNAANSANANQVIDPNQVYKQTLAAYQSQIDAINNIYNDQLNRSRIENAPGYQARLDQNRIQQLMGGFGSSAMGSAQTDQVQTLNNKEQSAADAIINDRRAQATAAIMGQVRQSSEEALTRKYNAQKEGAAAVLAEINARPEKRKAAVSSLVKKAISLGYTPEELTPETLASAAKDLGVSAEDLKSQVDAEYISVQKTQSDAKLKTDQAQATIDKTKAETAQLGKMTPYQTAQISIEKQRLAKETVTNQQYTQAAVQQMSGAIDKGVDSNGFLTPSQYKDVRKQWVQETGLTPASFDAYFADKAYTNDVDKSSPYTLQSYGISSTAEKTLPTVN